MHEFNLFDRASTYISVDAMDCEMDETFAVHYFQRAYNAAEKDTWFGCAEPGTPDLSTPCQFQSNHANHRYTDRGKLKQKSQKKRRDTEGIKAFTKSKKNENL